MNISKESFPDEDSIQQHNEKRNIHVLGSSSASSSSDQCNDHKAEDKLSQERRLTKLKNSIFKQKAHSYQDLHTDYTRKRYQHVKSKVKDYIASMKAYDRPKSNNILRHRSLPETIGHLADCQETVDDDVEIKSSSDDIVQSLLQEKDKEVEELRRLNQHLEDNLQEKLTMLARVKLNADIMRIELLEMKDKQKRASFSAKESRYSLHRGSLPVHILPFGIGADSNLKSTSTQTEFDSNSESAQTYSYSEEDNMNGTDVGHLREDFNFQTTAVNSQLRRRSFSNSMRCDATNTQQVGSDSSNETNCYDECFAIELEDRNDKIIDKNQHHVAGSGLNGRKRRPKVSWRQCLARPCKRVVLCCSQIPDMENDFVYTKLPVEEIPLS